MTNRIHLHKLSKEIVAFGFDQLTDKIDKFDEKVDYEDMTFENYSTKELEELCNKLREKIRDLKWEVEHGERNDFTIEELNTMRSYIASIEYRGKN